MLTRRTFVQTAGIGVAACTEDMDEAFLRLIRDLEKAEVA